MLTITLYHKTSIYKTRHYHSSLNTTYIHHTPPQYHITYTLLLFTVRINIHITAQHNLTFSSLANITHHNSIRQSHISFLNIANPKLQCDSDRHSSNNVQ
ncbi:hypothetical protein RND81_01G061400 [Saponaria officinalis]|uniref:Uncharacterized protein n=1 Tax=Saponaria officinalis TaxID=3572 RepID=A0AAW1N8X2_SAPOF